MRPISSKNKAIIDSDPYYKVCARHLDGSCDGRITIEHALIFHTEHSMELRGTRHFMVSSPDIL